MVSLNKEKIIIGLIFDKALNTTSAPAPSSFRTNSTINERGTKPAPIEPDPIINNC